MHDPLHTHGAFSWNELITSDPAAARAFYAKLFGWELEEAPMPGGGGSYTVIKVEGNQIGGIMGRPPGAPADMPPAWGAYVTVDDVDDTATRVEMLGGRVLLGPMKVPGVGRFALIQDPQGAVISAITYARP